MLQRESLTEVRPNLPIREPYRGVRKKNQAYVDQAVHLPFVTIIATSGEWTEGLSSQHRADWHLIQFILSPSELGHCYFQTTESRKVPMGRIAFHPANVTYGIVGGHNLYRGLALCIDPAYFARLTQIEHKDIRFLPDLLDSAIQNALVRLATEIANPGIGSEGLVQALSDAILVETARVLSGANSPVASGRFTHAELNQIMRYMESYGDASPTIQEIAKHMGISVRHLIRVFKASTGKTLYAYILQVRVRKAIGMLTNTDMTAKEISSRLGYKGRWGFSAAFQRETGQTPSEFRRNLRRKH